MVANYLIGLREGLEAALVVSILVAFLVKADRRNRLWAVWSGVGAALVLSAGLGAAIAYAATSLLSTFEQRELFGGVTSIVAVVFVTWMIFWMRRAARGLAGELRGRLAGALGVGAFSVGLVAFLAVLREGIETALIFWASAQAAGGVSGPAPLLSFSGGVVTAVVLGRLIYRGAIRLDLSRFFTWTGAALVLVAAGILAYGVYDLQEARFLPGLNSLAFDLSGVIDPSSWYAVLVTGTLNLSPAMSVLQVTVWIAYVVPVLALFLWPRRRRPAPPAPAVPPAPAIPAVPAERSTATAPA